MEISLKVESSLNLSAIFLIRCHLAESGDNWRNRANSVYFDPVSGFWRLLKAF
jgi:hypothetical protein